MAPIHRRRLTRDVLEKTIRGLTSAGKTITISSIAKATNTPFVDAKARLVECELLPRPPQPRDLSRQEIEDAIAKLREANKPPSIMGAAEVLQIKPGQLSRAWRNFGFAVKKGRPKAPPKDDAINRDLTSRNYSDREIARRHNRTPWAITLRRQRMGLPPYMDERKQVAYTLLLKGERAGTVAIKTGFERATVVSWLKEMKSDPLCLKTKDCCRKAVFKRTPEDIAPSICRKCAQ